MDRYVKVYKLIRLIIYLSAQGILFHIHFNGFSLALLNRDPLRWLNIVLYFLYVPIILITIVLSLKKCCRDKSSHPLGDQLSQSYFAKNERSRNVSMLVLIIFMICIAVFSQLYIQGIQDINIRGSSILLEITALIFTCIFALQSIVICYVSSSLKYRYLT